MPIKDIEEFWKLTLRPATADTRLSSLPVVIVSRSTLHAFFRCLREAIGSHADAILYRGGLEAGQAFVGPLAKWSGSEDPMELVDALGDVYSRCGWFAMESVEVDPVSRQARLRLKRSLETYGLEGRWDRPGCHFLRGYFAGFFRALFWSDGVECMETACRGTGDKVCEFLVRDASGA